jgi:hypothetical protein
MVTCYCTKVRPSIPIMSVQGFDLPGFSEPFIPVRRPGWGLNDIAA